MGFLGEESTPTAEAELAARQEGADSDVQTTVDAARERLKAIDPDAVEEVDEVVIAAIGEKRRKDLGLKEGEKTAGEMFTHLSPDQKAAVLATYEVTALKGVSISHPLYIDRKAVPDTIVLHWLSPRVTNGLGTRGFRRVLNTPETQKWAPNARQFASQKFITHGTYVLCMIDADTMLERRAKAFQLTNDILEQDDERFRSALLSASGMAGLSKHDAERLDRTGRGVHVTRGADPEYVRRRRTQGEDAKRDTVLGEGESGD